MSSWITTRKPRVRVQSSSRTEMSKETLVTASQTPGLVARQDLVHGGEETWRRCAWVTTTPLGVPVEPEV